MARLNWKTVRKTKAGRPVERTILRESSALSGVAAWLARRDINRKIGRFNSGKYSYTFTVTATYRFEGQRRIYKTALDVKSSHPGTQEKRVEASVAKAFRKNPGGVKHLTRGAFDIYQESVVNLIVKQGVYLPGSEGWLHGSKKVKGGRRKKNVFKRGLKRLDIGLVIERIPRKSSK